MPAIKFDSSLNISTVISIVLLIASVVGFGLNLRSNQKITSTQYANIKAELDDVKAELGELRRLHLSISNTVQTQGKSIEVVSKIAHSNNKQIKEVKKAQ